MAKLLRATKTTIPVANPCAQYLSHSEEIESAIKSVLRAGRYILGEEVSLFETEFSEYIGVHYGVGTGSGTEALHIALVACGIGRGDEVITVAHTAVATVAAIELAGAQSVLVDIEDKYFTIDPEKIEELITPQTKAIIPVHLYGLPADMTPIMEIAHRYDLKVIEDCAQAHGAIYKGKRAGSFGDMGCFSFYPTKNLGAIGDGGIIVTNNKEYATKARNLREYGWTERYVSHYRGWNSRLDELQAAILRVKLRYLDEDNTKRTKIAESYCNGLQGTGTILPKIRNDGSHAYHLYVVRSAERDALQAYLKSNNVSALIHYPVPVHLQPAYSNRLKGSDRLRVTEKIAKEILSLPMYPELTEGEVQHIIDSIFNFIRGKND